MSIAMLPFQSVMPCTETLRRALAAIDNDDHAADLLFLEQWEMHPLPGAAMALRISQIRRANPELAAAIRAEVGTLPR
jgi:hypothetical protein